MIVKKVKIFCRVPRSEIESFPKSVHEAVRVAGINGVKVSIVRPSRPTVSFAPPDLLNYAVSIIIIIAEGPDAAKKVGETAKVLRKHLKSRKVNTVMNE